MRVLFFNIIDTDWLGCCKKKTLQVSIFYFIKSSKLQSFDSWDLAGEKVRKKKTLDILYIHVDTRRSAEVFPDLNIVII